MATYYLIAGHGSGDPGAVGNGYQEWKLAREFNDLLAKYLKLLKQKVVIYNPGGTLSSSKDMYQETKKGKGLWRKTPNNDIIVENHLNAGSKTAKGTETLICMSLAADNYDKKMHEALAKFFVDRGIKKRADLLNMNVCAERGLNYRLNEMCFISNKADATKFVKEMDKVAREMAEKLVGKKVESSSQRIGIGKFVGESGTEVWCELFAWDIVEDYLNGLDRYRWGVKINTASKRDIRKVKDNTHAGQFKPNSTIRYMSLPKGLEKKMQSKL